MLLELKCVLSENVVTTCGITSIKHSPGDQRKPISAAKLADEQMKVLVECLFNVLMTLMV